MVRSTNPPAPRACPTCQIRLFEDPDRDERALYAKYWQHKLKGNKDIDFPDRLVDEIAHITNKFSFAYLKEALYVLHSPPSCIR